MARRFLTRSPGPLTLGSGPNFCPPKSQGEFQAPVIPRLWREESMKKVEGIIRPHLLDAVRTALQEVDVIGMTVSEVQGYGRQRGHTETYRGAEYQIEFVPKIKIEVIIPDDIEDFVVNAIVKA